MKRRLLCFVLTLAVFCGSLPTPAFAAQDAGQDAVPPLQCVCDTRCAEDAVNTGCPVCAADFLVCSGTAADETIPESQPDAGTPAAPLQNEEFPSYLDENGMLQQYTGTYTDVTADNLNWSAGWYLATGEVTLSGRAAVSGEVNLILADGASLTAPQGIQVPAGNSLTIWAQSTDETTMGKLTATVAGSNVSAIGGNDGQSVGDITINGGAITATGGAYAAGIGGAGGNVVVGKITINGGKVEASAAYAGAGIGGGNGAVGGVIAIHGGDVFAQSSGGAAIGTGNISTSVPNTAVTITGGRVKADGTDGAGIGAPSGSITITGGTVEAIGGEGAGIGFGALSRANATVDITISGGTVEATSNAGAGIGSGNSKSWSSSVTITGGSVTATSKAYGAGIGGASGSATDKTSTVTITGGVVRATGGSYGGAGIGGSRGGAGGNVTISGGTVTATGGSNAADIGAGAGGTGGSFSTGENGHAAIYAANITGSDAAADWDCIWFPSAAAGTVYGDVTLGADDTLTVAADQTLTVPAGATLTNNGSIANNGTIFVALDGGYAGAGTVSPNPVSYEQISYLDENGETKTIGADQVTLVTSPGDMSSLASGWYLVRGEITVPQRIRMTGDVTLVLEDGAHLQAEKGIAVESGSSLTITAQSKEADMGKLTATGYMGDAGIGGSSNAGSSGIPGIPGVPGAAGSDSGTIRIYGGTVNAYASYGAGIGGGSGADGGSGDYGGHTGGPGGDGGNGGSGGTILITGGIVNASSDTGVGIGGGNGGNGGNAGDGSNGGTGGPGGEGGNGGSGGSITITGGTVTAATKYTGTGIGGGIGGNAGNGGDSNGGGTAGPGGEGGNGGSAGSITITGGIVTVTTKDGNTDIGGGPGGEGGRGGSGGVSGPDGRNGSAGADGSFTTGENGSAIICADAISDSTGQDDWSCIRFNSAKTSGTVYGDVILAQDFALPAGATLTIPDGASLTVPDTVTLTSEGRILVNLNGAYTGKQPAGAPIQYQIAWDTDGDGTIDEQSYQAYDTVLNPAEPTKPGNAQYRYVFAGWSPQVTHVTAAVQYTAQFTQITNQYAVTAASSKDYTVVFENGDISSTAADYGTAVSFRVNLAEGCVRTDAFSVEANGTALTEQNGTYTLLLTEDTTITVTGVAAAYQILSGDNSIWTPGGTAGLTITANGPLDRLVELRVNGGYLAPEYYTVRAGSTIATLTPAYLNSLAPGQYTLTFVYENGQTSATFQVAEAPVSTDPNGNGNAGGTDSAAAENSAGNTGSPQTGDSNNPGMWLALLAASALILVLAQRKRERT